MAVDAVRRDNVMGSEALPSGADYDMWIKMAADNKINAKNSWNLALIDYFYDLSFQPVTNFQKMSAILDGCIKIYSSRVDSAVNETGTLLSGLSSNEHLKSALSFTAEQSLGANSGEDSSDIEVSQAAKVYRRRNIRENTLAKSFDELKVKNLENELLVDPMFKKTLSYFDGGGSKSLLLNNLTTDRSGRVVLDSNHYVKDEMEVSSETTPLPDESWRTLKQLYANGPSMEGSHVCESLPALKQLISDIDEVKLSDGKTTSPLDHIYDTNEDDRFNDYNDIDFNDDDENDEQNEDLENDSMDRFASAGVPDQELMEYFDNTMKRSATQLPVYWKVQRLKSTTPKVHAPQEKNKEEARELIHFHGSMEEDAAFENEIFSTSNAKIAIPVVHRNKGISCNNFCLTDEGNYTTQRLVSLFTKPLQSLRAFQKADVIEEPESDSESAYDYYYGDEPSRLLGEVTREDIDELNHSYIEDFSQPFPTQQANFAKQLNYEKISKRIDIGAIKEKMMGELKDEVKFSELTKNIPAYLNGSTGVYFICLLHLCNECSLDLQHTEDEDLLVNRIT